MFSLALKNISVGVIEEEGKTSGFAVVDIVQEIKHHQINIGFAIFTLTVEGNEIYLRDYVLRKRGLKAVNKELEHLKINLPFIKQSDIRKTVLSNMKSLKKALLLEIQKEAKKTKKIQEKLDVDSNEDDTIINKMNRANLEFTLSDSDDRVARFVLGGRKDGFVVTFFVEQDKDEPVKPIVISGITEEEFSVWFEQNKQRLLSELSKHKKTNL